MTTHPSYESAGENTDVLAQGSVGGFEYLVRHNGIGYRCGYVCIPKGHPWHGIDYDKITAEAHGGLTYSERGTDGSWWVGFDCAHCFDAPDASLYPKSARYGLARGEIRTTEYVRQQCIALCEQAAAVAKAAEETSK